MAHERMTDVDRQDVAAFVEQHWHSKTVMSRGRAVCPHEKDAFLERRDGKIVGLVTFCAERNAMEVLTLNSVVEGAHLGTSLMLRVIADARERGLNRVWLTTTNDNTRAMTFFQRLGFRITEVHPGAVDEARKIKPQIPEYGQDGIPIHDELELELKIQPFLTV